MKTEKILMLGGRGSGKSSILAAIYEQANEVMRDTDLYIKNDLFKGIGLAKKLGLLKSVFETNNTGSIIEVNRVPTAGIDKYYMQIGKIYEKPTIELEFIDIPGGVINGEGTETIQKQAGKAIKESRVAVLAIDVVELMNKEKISGKNRKNLPDQTLEWIKSWLNEAKQKIDGKIIISPRLLCVVPIKIESWCRERKGLTHAEAVKNNTLITNNILKTYDCIFKELARDKKNIGIVITPVQTAGNIIFNDYQKNEEQDAYPIERWKLIEGLVSKEQPNIGYAPLNCEQPLRYILNFFLVEQIKNEREKQHIISENDVPGVFKKAVIWLNEITTIVDDLTDGFSLSIAKLTQDIKEGYPNKIIQGENLLKRNSVWNFFFQK